MSFESYREASRKNWGKDPVKTTTGITDENIKLGCLLRIADSCELMAKDRERMEREIKWLSESRANYIKSTDKLKSSNAALRGVITKLKKQLKKEGEQ